MIQRISVKGPFKSITDLNGSYDVVDNDGVIICQHRFIWHSDYTNAGKWLDAHQKIAQAIADALNAVPGAAIEHIRQTQREADHIKQMMVKHP